MSPEHDPKAVAGPAADALTQKILGQEGRRLRVVERELLLQAFDLAVRDALERESVTFDAAEAAAVSGSARRRFVELLGRHAKEGRGFSSAEFLRAVAMARDQLLATRERFRHEIAELEAEVDQRRSAARAEQTALERAVDLVTDPARSPVAARLREMFAQAGTAGPETLRLRDEVVLYVLNVIRSERRKAVELQVAEHARELDNLERRIHKLVQSLETTEEQLKRLARMKGMEPGLASIYREVQGLGDDELNAELKRELLTRIFEANIRLKEQLEAQKSGS
ncbi:MAG: hypothetical protein EYC70_07725 [Planctomycetota bacterium]|nr:MAG: hypothetical protein EYC70_07725 [Planctomycetota bacterium]